VIRFSGRAGPALAVACVVCIGGLGLHAAHDWHRHGQFGSGFFHIHFHVGHHDHDHQGHDDHDHDNPADTKQRSTAVLTIALAFDNDASATVAAAPGKPAPDRTPIDGVVLPRSTAHASLANPRAPPA
jgi:hypothetical protein